MKRLSLAMACVALSLAACAQDAPPAVAAKPGAKATRPATPVVASAAEPRVAAGTPDARARDAIRSISPAVRIEQIGAAPIKGFREAIVEGQVIYISDDGRYLMQGALFDVATKQDMGRASMAAVRKKLIATIPMSDRIVFAPPAPKYTVTVFTDVECGYCRKFHSEIADYNRRGIAVQYLAFPRMGPASEDFRKMVSVWCASDRRKALTDAKNDRAPAKRDCTNPVAMEYDVGRRVGLTGTPMIVASDGTELGGYLPPDKLRAALDKLAAGKAVQKSDATESTATGTGAGAR
jgi:thiol:disulfide interchange protein DsbC